MADQGRPLVDRVWEFTKDLSVKVSRKAEKHWKINTLRVEIASIKHRINVKYKELGRYVYESIKSGTLEEESYKSMVRELYDDLSQFEGEIVDRENRIQILEQEMDDMSQPPPPPVMPDQEEETDSVEEQLKKMKAEQATGDVQSEDTEPVATKTKEEAPEPKKDPEPKTKRKRSTKAKSKTDS